MIDNAHNVMLSFSTDGFSVYETPSQLWPLMGAVTKMFEINLLCTCYVLILHLFGTYLCSDFEFT
jgi:hypothetical protein